MTDDIDPREDNRDKRRDHELDIAARKPMDNGSAKRWHAIDQVVRKRGQAARRKLDGEPEWERD